MLFAAFSTAGVPNALVSDGGSIFYCKQAMDVYSALGITKERIEKRQAWQNYIETHFNIVRRMAGAKFARASSWEEILAIHRKWMHDYNGQRHWGHEARDDGCHSPVDVLGGHKGQYIRVPASWEPGFLVVYEAPVTEVEPVPEAAKWRSVSQRSLPLPYPMRIQGCQRKNSELVYQTKY